MQNTTIVNSINKFIILNDKKYIAINIGKIHIDKTLSNNKEKKMINRPNSFSIKILDRILIVITLNKKYTTI